MLNAFKSEQQSLEFVFPGKGSFDPHPQRMDGFVEEAFAPTLDRLAVARILFDIGDQARVENALPIGVPGVIALMSCWACRPMLL